MMNCKTILKSSNHCRFLFYRFDIKNREIKPSICKRNEKGTFLKLPENRFSYFPLAMYSRGKKL